MKEKRLIRFDWAMKRLLREKTNYGILEGLLSELLGEDIKIDHLLESESNKEKEGDMLTRVDILALNSKGELIIIEVQGNRDPDYLLRMAFGASKFMVDYSIKGMRYREIKKIISLNILYFNFGQGDDYIYHGTTTFKGLHTNGILKPSAADQLIFHTDEIARIYPEYYIIKVDQFNDVSKNTLDEWINFLKNEVVKDGTKAKGLPEAKIKLDVMKMSQKERLEYESYLNIARNNISATEGNFLSGKLEGEANKEKYAEEKAKDEVKKKAIEIAKSCLKDGMSIPKIAKLTGLTEAEIKTLNP